MNPAAILKISGAWRTFCGNHPRFPAFISAVKQVGIHEGMVIEVSVTTADGKTINSNVKLTASDIRAYEDVSGAVN